MCNYAATYGSRHTPWAPAGMGKRGHLPPSCPCLRALAPLWIYKVFLCISGYSKTLSRRIIYALFSQPVVGFWGFAPRPPGGLTLDPTGGLSSPCPYLPTPKKILQAPILYTNRCSVKQRNND